MGSFHEVKDLTSILSARSDWSPLGQGQWGEEGRLQGSPWKAGGAGKTQVPAWGSVLGALGQAAFRSGLWSRCPSPSIPGCCDVWRTQWAGRPRPGWGPTVLNGCVGRGVLPCPPQPHTPGQQPSPGVCSRPHVPTQSRAPPRSSVTPGRFLSLSVPGLFMCRMR